MGKVIVVGVGAVGSWLVPLVTRMRDVSHVTLIDEDTYDEGNFRAQYIEQSDIGQPKVLAQAARIRAINPEISVETHQERIEHVPTGLLRDALILCCVDNRRARQVINRVSQRLGNIWLDAAVNSPSQLRVTTYVPGEDQPCLECAWDQRSYELLEQEYPCANGGTVVAPTQAPAELGAVAAAMLAVELRKVLESKDREEIQSGLQLMFDTGSGETHLTRFRNNPECRLDHNRWAISELDMAVETHTLAELFRALEPGTAIGIEGHVFFTQLDCAHCDGRLDLGLRLYGRTKYYCDECDGELLASGFATREFLRESDLEHRELELLLEEVGFRNGDVLSVVDELKNHSSQRLLGDSCRV